MNPATPHRIRVLAGIIGLLLTAAVVGFIIQYSNGALAGGYPVRAVFDRAGQGLYSGSDVKLRGVTVGAVRSIRLQTSGRVAVELRLHDGIKVPDSTSASIEPLSVFGPKYVNLAPGPHEANGPYLRAGDAIARTTSATEVLDVLNRIYPLLAAVDANELGTVVHTLGSALEGLGPDLGQTLDNAKIVADHAQADIPNLEALLADLAKVTNALAPLGGELVSVAQDLNQVLPEISTQPDRIASLLDGTAQLASHLAGLLEGHRQGLDNVVNGLSTVIAAIYPDRAELPVLVETLNQFFGFLNGIIREPGRPIVGGRLSGNVKGYVPSDPCTGLQGTCPGR